MKTKLLLALLLAALAFSPLAPAFAHWGSPAAQAAAAAAALADATPNGPKPGTTG